MTPVPAKLLATSLLAILALAAVPSPATFATSDDELRAQVFLNVAEGAHDLLVRLMERAAEAGIDTSTVDPILAAGDVLLAEAHAACEAANYPLCADKARDAAQTYREGLQELGELAESLAETDATVGQGLLEAIEALRRVAARLETAANAVASSETSEPYRDWVLDNLTEAHEHLDAAEQALMNSPTNATLAAHELAAANHDLREAARALGELARMLVAERLGSFFNRVVQALLMGAQQALDRAAARGADPAVVGEIQVMIDTANSTLEEAVLDIDEGRVEEGLEGLRQVRQLLLDIFRELVELRQALVTEE
jgi:hypothetical protein